MLHQLGTAALRTSDTTGLSDAAMIAAAPPPRPDESLINGWAERYLSHPLLGSLVHVAEGAALLVGADVVAGRIFARDNDRFACAYVGTPGLETTPEQRAALQHWPMGGRSLFGSLARCGSAEPIVLVRCLLMDPSVMLASAVDPSLRPACRLADAFALTVPIDDSRWAALLLLRHRRRMPFVGIDRERLARQRTRMSDTFRRTLHLAAAPAAPPSPDQLIERLSQTERDVLRYLQQGLTERQVADRLDRSPNTVHVHVKSIYRKLAVRSRQQLRAMLEGEEGAEGPGYQGAEGPGGQGVEGKALRQ